MAWEAISFRVIKCILCTQGSRHKEVDKSWDWRVQELINEAYVYYYLSFSWNGGQAHWTKLFVGQAYVTSSLLWNKLVEQTAYDGTRLWDNRQMFVHIVDLLLWHVDTWVYKQLSLYYNFVYPGFVIETLKKLEEIMSTYNINVHTCKCICICFSCYICRCTVHECIVYMYVIMYVYIHT